MTVAGGIPAGWRQEAEQVLVAAQQGRWEAVQDYYQRREAWVRLAAGNADLSACLVTLDREVEQMIQVAQAALATAIHETAASKRMVAQLRASFTAGSEHDHRMSRRF